MSDAANSTFNFPIGTILMLATRSALPADWLVCNGEPIPAVYPELRTQLGPNLPNLIGRSLIGAGETKKALTKQSDGRDPSFSSLGEGLVLGQTGGECVHTLLRAEMPKHGHRINHGDFGIAKHSYESNRADSDHAFETHAHTPVGGTETEGENRAHNNLQPYFVVTYIIYAGRPQRSQ